MSPPGILYVTMQPQPDLAPAAFDDWYNNEHGPARLRLRHIFTSGLRYRATSSTSSSGTSSGTSSSPSGDDDAQPAFMAVYDVEAMHLLRTPAYTSLRAHRSAREAAVVARVAIQRSFYRLLHDSDCSDSGSRSSASTESEEEAIVAVAFHATLDPHDPRAAAALYRDWFVDEHVGMLARVRGWRRSRLFALEPEAGDDADAPATTLLGLHEYAAAGANGLGGTEHRAAMATPRRADVFARAVASWRRHVWARYYVFGPAPRDLASLAEEDWTSPDGRTTTGRSPPAIESFVPAGDGDDAPELRYRLEGNPAPGAPTVAFSNSLLTSLRMWDPLVALLRRARPELRILRYDTRGRHAGSCGAAPATSLDALASDLVRLLDALRVPRLHALVGVSLGGATALRLALDRPDRLARLVGCDFNAASSAANTAAWRDRVALADEDGGHGIRHLARQTVARWFHPASLDRRPDLVAWLTDMLAANDVAGFRHACTALWDYDMRPDMPACAVPALLVVGEVDAKGALVDAMAAFRPLLGSAGAELKVVPGVGHLPMVEDPDAFWATISHFL